MRSRPSKRAGITRPGLFLWLLSASLLASARASIVLSQFQEIGGFPIACTQAYLTPLNSCQTSDFSPPDAPCSEGCFQDLVNITSAINNACKGITVNPQTLIGLFFEGKGAAALCPSVIIGESNPSSPPAPPPSQPSIINNPPPAAASTTTTSSPDISETFIMTSTQGAVPTDADSSSSVTPVQPMPTGDGASSESGAVAGTQEVSSTQAAANSASTNGPGTFGGGAIPFTVNSSASAVGLSNVPSLALVFGTSVLLVVKIL